MAELGTQAEVPPESPASPPPNCPICLGNCMNRSYSDSCMHEFCFRCLLEWSKVKPVCPLCNRSFTKILHSIKSNSEYEQYDIIPAETTSRQGFYEFHLLTVPQSARHFQLRTTFTVEPRTQMAIQRMLSSYPIGNNIRPFDRAFDAIPSRRVRLYRHRLRANRPPPQSTNFRRYIYAEHRWVSPPGNFTSYARDISPEFYRNNPAAKFRLEAWLNRELNALLDEDQVQVEFVRNKIMTELDNHHIQSRYFRQLLEEYLTVRTSHFIHEFSCFMRSTYDMIGYDRFADYTNGTIENAIDVLDDTSSSNSDVEIVSVSQQSRPQEPSVVIDLDSDTSRDSDVVIQEPPPPPIVDLLDTDDSEEKLPILPFKKRLLLKRVKKSYKRSRKNEFSTSSSEESSSETTSRKLKHKRKHKKSIYYIVKTSDDGSDSSDDDNTVLSELQKKQDIKRKRARKQDYSKIKQKLNAFPIYLHKNDEESNANANGGLKEETVLSDNSGSYTPPPKSPRIDKKLPSEIFEESKMQETIESTSDNKSNESNPYSSYSPVSDNEENTPSTSHGGLNQPMDLWYNRPNIYSSSYDSSD